MSKPIIIHNPPSIDVQLNEKTISTLFDLMVKAEGGAPIRRHAAILLHERLHKLQNWQTVSSDIQREIKSNILNKILEEKECSVRTEMCKLLSEIISHESNTADDWFDSILRRIFECCTSPDSNISELLSDVFAKLAVEARHQFVSHFDAISEMFVDALTAAEARGNMATPVIRNIVAGMTASIPYRYDKKDTEKTLCNSVPFIIKTLYAMSKQPDVEMFRTTFKFLGVMLDRNTNTLNASIKPLMEFCMVLGQDATLNPMIRIDAVDFIGSLAWRLENEIVINANLLKPTLTMIFELIASHSGDDEGQFYFLDSNVEGLKTTACKTLRNVARNMPPEKLTPPLMAILESALRNNDPWERMAAYVCIAIITKASSDVILDQYLPTLIETIQKRCAGSDVKERNAAFYALLQFSNHWRSNVTEYLSQILPILLLRLHQLCDEIKGRDDCIKLIEYVFKALNAYLRKLDDDVLTLYTPELMAIIFKALDAVHSPNLRKCAMQFIVSAWNSVQKGMLPYFEAIITFLQQYVVNSKQEDIVNLQPKAIDTLNALAKSVKSEEFMPFATMTKDFALKMLETNREKKDSELHKSLYDLFSSLSTVLKNEMTPVFTKIMKSIFYSLLSKEPAYGFYAGGRSYGFDEYRQHRDNKEAAIEALGEFAENSPEAFFPYLEKAFQGIYKNINHEDESVQTPCFRTLIEFLLLLHKQNDDVGVETALKTLFALLCKMAHENDSYEAEDALEHIKVILTKMEKAALPNQEFRDSIYKCIETVCQLHFDDEGYEDEETLFDYAVDLLPNFGVAMEPELFASYFERILPLLLKKLDKKPTNNETCNRIYFVLAECFLPLGTNCEIFFDTLCPVLIEGFGGANKNSNSIYALGELVLHSKEKSFSEYPTILQALTDALRGQEDPLVLDNICGAIALLIITNFTLVPLEQILPIFFQHLPLRHQNTGNEMILKCLNTLYGQALNAVQPMLEKLIAVAVASITGCFIKDNNKMIELGLNLLNSIENDYPNEFTSVLNSVPPEQNQKLQSLIQNRANQ